MVNSIRHLAAQKNRSSRLMDEKSSIPTPTEMSLTSFL